MATAVLITIVILKPNLSQGGKTLTSNHIIGGLMDNFSVIDVNFNFKFSISAVERLLEKTNMWLTNPRDFKNLTAVYRSVVNARIAELALDQPVDSDMSKMRYVAKKLAVVTERRTRKDEITPFQLPTTTDYDNVWSAHLKQNGEVVEFVYRLKNLNTDIEKEHDQIEEKIICFIDSKSILCTYPVVIKVDAEYYKKLFAQDVAREINEKAKSGKSQDEILQSYLTNVFKPTMFIQRDGVAKGDLINNHIRILKRYGANIHTELFGQASTLAIAEETEKRKLGRQVKKRGKNPRRNIEDLRKILDSTNDGSKL